MCNALAVQNCRLRGKQGTIDAVLPARFNLPIGCLKRDGTREANYSFYLLGHEAISKAPQTAEAS
jgi:hypothetical protein